MLYLKLYLINEDSGTLIEKGATATVIANITTTPFLILLHFTNTDLEKDKWDWGGFQS
jgi:hypothetical protein